MMLKFSMQRMSRAQVVRLFIVSLIGVGAWMVAIKTGERLPYLVTAEARSIRLAIVFPTLTALLAWFVLVHRWKETGKTGYAMRMAQIDSRKERITQTALGLGALLVIPLMVAWSSIHLVAWVAHLAANEPFAQTYQILDRKSVTAGFSFDMYSRSTGQEVALRVPLAWGSGLGPGMNVCAQGRSSMFGTVIESLRRAECSSPLRETRQQPGS